MGLTIIYENILLDIRYHKFELISDLKQSLHKNCNVVFRFVLFLGIFKRLENSLNKLFAENTFSFSSFSSDPKDGMSAFTQFFSNSPLLQETFSSSIFDGATHLQFEFASHDTYGIFTAILSITKCTKLSLYRILFLTPRYFWTLSIEGFCL